MAKSSAAANLFSLHGRRALVTGSGQGIGLTLARESTEKGKPGVIVERVDDGSPADKVGIEAGMVVTEVGGKATHTLVDARARDA